MKIADVATCPVSYQLNRSFSNGAETHRSRVDHARQDHHGRRGDRLGGGLWAAPRDMPAHPDLPHAEVGRAGPVPPGVSLVQDSNTQGHSPGVPWAASTWRCGT